MSAEALKVGIFLFAQVFIKENPALVFAIDQIEFHGAGELYAMGERSQAAWESIRTA